MEHMERVKTLERRMTGEILKMFTFRSLIAIVGNCTGKRPNAQGAK
jgi:hypothetical protein